MADVGVIYLYRFAEGAAPARRFIESYRNYPAGAPHDLYIVYKGFPNQSVLDEAFALFDDLSAQPIVLDDTDFDIGSYVAAARQVSNRYLLFLNTFSRILTENWLRVFTSAIAAPGVGLVGATGSWQSLFSIQFPNGYPGLSPSRVQRWLQSYLRYPPFPNVHIRTNAFLVERRLFLSLRFPPFAKKDDVHQFESGRRSLTRQILKRGLAAVVVDKNGQAHRPHQWPRSETFWNNTQSQLLIADNQTDDYSFGNKERRHFLNSYAWQAPALVRQTRSRVGLRPAGHRRMNAASCDIRPLDGVIQTGDEEWTLTAPTGQLEIETTRTMRYVEIAFSAAAISPSFVWAEAIIHLPPGNQNRVGLGPISRPRQVQAILRLPHHGGQLSLRLLGPRGARVRISSVRLRKLGLLKQLDMLGAFLPESRSLLLRILRATIANAFRLRLDAAEQGLRDFRIARRELTKKYNERFLMGYDSFLAASELPQTQQDHVGGKYDIAIVAVIRKNDVQAEWRRRLLEAARTAAPGVLVALADAAELDPELTSFFTAVRLGHSTTYPDLLQALRQITASYVIVLDDENTLHPAFMQSLAAYLADNGPLDMVYTDEDTLNTDGLRHHPIFKPDWSPILEEHRSYIGNVIVYRSEWLKSLPDRVLEKLTDDPRAALAHTDATPPRVGHIPLILTHRICTPERPTPHGYRACQSLAGRVSIVIPTVASSLADSQKVDLLRKMVNNLRSRTSWSDLEIIAVGPTNLDQRHLLESDNIRIAPISTIDSFNWSQKMNAGAAMATGEFIVFLGNNIQVISSDWIERMMALAVRPEIGIVGPLLLNEDGAVQQAGMTFSDGQPRHLYQDSHPGSEGYLGWLSAPHECSAVSGACMMLRREAFKAIGGFDERFITQYGDIDLCMRARQMQLSVVIEPRAKLYCFERLPAAPKTVHDRDVNYFLGLWESKLDHDPFYPRVFQHDNPETTMALLAGTSQ